MTDNSSELERLIMEKNLQMDRLNQDMKPDSEELYKVYDELDRILYLYYKSLRNKRDLMTLIKIIR